MHLSSENAGQNALLLLVGTQSHQRRTHTVEGEQWQWHPGPVGLFDEYHLVDRPPSLTAVFQRPSQTEPAVLTHPADIADVGRLALAGSLHLGDETDEVGAQFVLQLLLFPRQRQV